MAKKNDTANLTELLLQCMGEVDPMLSMLEWLCTHLMEAEVSEQLGAEKTDTAKNGPATEAGIARAGLTHVWGQCI